MVKLLVKSSVFIDYKHIDVGEIIDVDDEKYKDLVRTGKFEKVESFKKMKVSVSDSVEKIKKKEDLKNDGYVKSIRKSKSKKGDV